MIWQLLKPWKLLYKTFHLIFSVIVGNKQKSFSISHSICNFYNYYIFLTSVAWYGVIALNLLSCRNIDCVPYNKNTAKWKKESISLVDSNLQNVWYYARYRNPIFFLSRLVPPKIINKNFEKKYSEYIQKKYSKW